MEKKFYLCTVCGNVVVKAVDSGMDLSCCGSEMKELVPDSTDGSGEKHVPYVETRGSHTVSVKVGSSAHPMTKDHYIMFIYLETEHGGQICYLKPDEPAEAVFFFCDDKPVAVYAYCNIHGLWKAEVGPEKKRCCFLTLCH